MRFYLCIPPEGEAILTTVQPKAAPHDIVFEIECDVALPEGSRIEKRMSREDALARIQETIRGKGDFSMGCQG